MQGERGDGQPPPPPPQLSLYLDAEPFGFTTSNPQSDHTEYVPGSLLNGTSVPVSTILGAGQEVRLIAAFVNQSGQIVAPPSGVTQVQFSLHDTSALRATP